MHHSTHVCVRTSPVCFLRAAQIAWKLSRQLDRIMGPNYHLLETVHVNYQAILALPIPPKRDYFRRKGAFY